MSHKTLRRRSDELNQHRLAVSGSEGLAQLQSELRSITSDERQAVLKDLEFKIEIPALTSLALKYNLCLPWNKMRNLKRFEDGYMDELITASI